MSIITLPNLALDQPSIVIQLPTLNMSDDQLFEFTAINRELRVERTATGELIVMTPAGGESSDRNAEITMQLRLWAKKNGKGTAFDSSAGFILPNTAVRSPDSSWVSKARLSKLTAEQRRKFMPLCPEFVVELVSPADRLRDVKAKLEEYIEQGAQLGLLIDADEKRVYIYRPNVAPQELVGPDTVACDPELPGFTLDLREIW